VVVGRVALTGRSKIRKLGVAHLGLIAEIDRSERVEVEYAVVDGELTTRPVSMIDVPAWDPVGTGPHSVAAQIAFCEPLVMGGAVFLGAVDGNETLGLAIVDTTFGEWLAWLAFLYVSRPHRGRRVASALWDAAVGAAVAADATAMYVSAVPTGSAVGFYLSRGCRLADPVHPALYAKEPDDIHLVCPLP
jgi:GNAT superfamily N-acetyltransferase